MEKAIRYVVLLVLLASFLSLASGLTISEVSSNPIKVNPGDVTQLYITIENNLDNDAENVDVALDLKDIPVAPYGSSSEQSIDKIRENKEEVFIFRLIADPNSASGIYKIPVKISYFINGQKSEKTGTVSIIIESEPRITLHVEGYLIRELESKIVVRIVNDGLSDVKLASFSVGSLDRTQINSPSYEYIGNLDSDDEESVELKINTMTNGVLLLPVTLNYKDSNNKDYRVEENLIVPVYTKKEAESKGLVEKSNYTLYVVAGLIVVLIVFWRWRKQRAKVK